MAHNGVSDCCNYGLVGDHRGIMICVTPANGIIQGRGAWKLRASLLADSTFCNRLRTHLKAYFFFFFQCGYQGNTRERVKSPGSKHSSIQARSEHPRWIPITFLHTTGGETRAKHFCFPFEGTHDREISGEGRHPSLKV